MGNRIRDFMFGEELPGESMPWQTVTELIDNTRVLIENHRGIIAYSCEKILIKLPTGHLCVTGCDLCVACMSRQQLIIKGTILSITVTKGK
ncbi:MAG: YabP/YqfC family sporulation protein [Oscillospiraceae bacterium]|nr:YabP/YqfC family sporulation protein [Oscillospiraceae bacterium]